MSEQAAQSKGDRYRIVVGVDFQEPGEHALAEALRIAREHAHDELHLVHVVKLAGNERSAEAFDKAADAMGEAAKQLQDSVQKKAAELFPDDDWEQHMVFHVRVGEPADALLQVAVDYDAHLLVVGTHGRTGMDKLLLGSVAETLMRKARLPLLIARPRDFSGLEKSSRPDEGRPGEILHDENYHIGGVARFGGRASHVSGLV